MDVIVLGIAAVTALVAIVLAGSLLIRWHRNQFRFNMRALMLTVAVVAGGLAVILQFILPMFEHRWALHQVKVAGGRINFPEDEEQHEPGYDPRRHRWNYWRGVTSINVGGDQEAIAVAKHLESIPELQQVRLYGVTDIGLDAILRLDTNPTLSNLDFYDSQISSTGFSDASNVKNIQGLFFNTCQVDGATLACLKSMPALHELWLLEEGKLANPGRYTLDSFAEIGDLENLEVLRLTNLQISDNAALYLHNLKRLKKLSLNGCQMSEQSLADIQAALPECEIICHDRDDE